MTVRSSGDHSTITRFELSTSFPWRGWRRFDFPMANTMPSSVSCDRFSLRRGLIAVCCGCFDEPLRLFGRQYISVNGSPPLVNRLTQFLNVLARFETIQR
jgi:hypothetical protein